MIAIPPKTACVQLMPQMGVTRRAVLRLMTLAPFAVSAPQSLLYAANQTEEFRRIPKGMWVWSLNVDSSDTLKAFAAVHGIEMVLLSLPAEVRAGLLKDDETLLSKIRSLRDGPTNLIALTGDPSWAEHPGRMPRSLSELLQIETRHHLFDGLHLDVEPHALPAWDENERRRAQLLQGLIEFFASVRRSAPSLPLDAALPPQYAAIILDDGENALESLARGLTMVSLMAYRDQPEAAVEWAASAIRVLERTSVSWRLGVLVHASKERGTSYVGTDAPRFTMEMVRVDRLLRDEFKAANYRGLVFEDYDGLHDILGS